MIRANVRQHLTRADAQLALRLVATGSNDAYASAESALRERGIDALLDDPRLVVALISNSQAAHASLPLFTYVLVRHALKETGEGDRAIADFVTSILLHFGEGDRAHRIGEFDDETYQTLAALVADAESGDAPRAFLVRAHLGNYSLWLAGLFPDHIEHRRHRRGGPDLEYFDEMGRRGYLLAANHHLAEAHGLAGLFETVADRFGRIRVALNRLSDQVFFPNHHSPERLIRQVRDEARWMLS